MFVCFCWTTQLTPPTFSPYIWVNFKLPGFVKGWKYCYKSFENKNIVFIQWRLLRKRNLDRVPDGHFGWRWSLSVTLHLICIIYVGAFFVHNLRCPFIIFQLLKLKKNIGKFYKMTLYFALICLFEKIIQNLIIVYQNINDINWVYIQTELISDLWIMPSVRWTCMTS